MSNGNAGSRATVSLARLLDEALKEKELAEVIHKALEPIGGVDRYFARGKKVLLKPNQTLFKNALSGSTTSPRLIRSLIHLAFEAGAKEVWVAEAAGHAQQTRRVMSKTGMLQAVKGTRAQLIFLDEIAEKVYDFGEEAGELRYMPAPEIMERADVIINVPKAKTHFVDPISCACKNYVGVMPMSYRLYLQRLGEAYYRGTALLLKKFKPTLNIVDGGIAGQGQGPGSNDAFWWGWLLASEDPVALDITVCRLFGLDWQKLRMSREAAQAGVGIFDADAIDMVGATLQEASVSVRAADTSVHRYPCRVLVGNGATIEGTLGHWKTIADAWLETNLWLLFTSRGTPTFMFGEVEDPDFEQHIQEGPYVVLGDTCLEKYKFDPRVIYVPGWPVPQSYIQHEMVDRMGFGALYEPGLKMFQTGSSLLGRLRGVSGPKAQRKAWLGTLGMAAAAAGLSWLVTRGAKLAGSEA